MWELIGLSIPWQLRFWERQRKSTVRFPVRWLFVTTFANHNMFNFTFKIICDWKNLFTRWRWRRCRHCWIRIHIFVFVVPSIVVGMLELIAQFIQKFTQKLICILNGKNPTLNRANRRRCAYFLRAFTKLFRHEFLDFSRVKNLAFCTFPNKGGECATLMINYKLQVHYFWPFSYR